VVELECKVFWQCVSYAFAFFITWPITFSVYVGSSDITLDSYAFTLIFALVAPLQGFNNFLVYVRPRWAGSSSCRKPTGRSSTPEVSASSSTTTT